MALECIKCGSEFPIFPPRSLCEKCGGLLDYNLALPKRHELKSLKHVGFWRYKQLLPPVSHMITLGEGGTPIHMADRLAKFYDLKRLYLKDETRNPTSSYRDRAAALLTSNAIDLQHNTVACASMGNLGASLAAYCAKAGLNCHVLVPKIVDAGKLAQMLVYDATIEEFGEFIDETICKADMLAKETGWYQATAELNPLVIEAQKTISYEIFEQFGVPDWVIVSMGSGGTIYSIWKGFKELEKLDMAKSLPKMVGVQPEGSASIVKTWLAKRQKAVKISKPSTKALALLVKEPMQSELAIKALKESRGLALTVSDSEVFEAELEMAKFEGLFAEPASSAEIAALKKLVNKGKINKDESVVCLITGSGLKTTDILQALTKKQKTAALGLELSTKEKILRILSEKDTYGYDIWEKLGKTMTRAAIYQHLAELYKKGLIAGYMKDRRKFFKITQRGKKVLQAIDDLKILL